MHGHYATGKVLALSSISSSNCHVLRSSCTVYNNAVEACEHTQLLHHPQLSTSDCCQGNLAPLNVALLQYAGVIIAPVAVLFMLYAFFMYRKRTAQILLRRTVRFDDQLGPLLLVVMLVSATTTALVLTAIGARL